MIDQRAAIYGAMADRMERDPVQTPDANGRATVPMGRGFQAWRRFHPNEETVWVENPEGQLYELTRNQVSVLTASFGCEGTGPITMRGLGAQLKLSPSTISRALVKLASFGLIAYLTGRGRYAGTVIIRRVKADGLERFRVAAKAKVRAWSEAAQRRIARLWVNVAPYVQEDQGVGSGSLYRDSYYLLTENATLTRPWTPDDLREAGII